jgi:hypothetical protein
MTNKPWTEEDVEAVCELVQNFNPLTSDEGFDKLSKTIAVEILELLHSRGLLKSWDWTKHSVLIGSKKIQSDCTSEPITLTDLKERYPELIKQAISEYLAGLHSIETSCHVPLAAIEQIQAEERERCAKVCEDKCTEILSKQTGKIFDGYDTDSHLRMMVVLLPDIADSIRSLPPTKAEG